MMMPTPREPGIATRTNAPRERIAMVEQGSLRTPQAYLSLAAASCRGKRHDVNEDSYSALDGATPVYVVADGVGGGAMASRASRELVQRLHRALEGAHIDADAVRHALLAADRAVARSLAAHTDQLGAATVALCAGADERLSTWLVAWVGDCRAYRVDGAGLTVTLLTHDDTYRHLAETPPAGSSPDDPARMVGNGAVSMPNLTEVALGDDEMLVLCSDGVHKYVEPPHIGGVLAAGPAPLARRCARLVALARLRGSLDDATVLVVHRAALAAPKEELDDAA
jgi:serine/threonine protein phosphatase PrpC